MTQFPAVQNMNAPVVYDITDYAMQTDNVLRQVQMLQTIMHKVMKQDEHYGTIPGCGDKPALLKPGAEKILMTFRLAPAFDIDERQLAGEHREYSVKATLTAISTGAFIGQGVGSATTKETKWRYRNENTGRKVPKEYWDTRDSALLGGAHCKPRKVNGEWFVYEQIEHDNPAYYYNTCLKMAKKRALVDAVLTCTAASDIFTQDVEEDPSLYGGAQPDSKKDQGRTQPTEQRQGRQPSQNTAPSGNGDITDKQINMIWRSANDAGFNEDSLHEAFRRHFEAGSVHDLSKRQASQVIDFLKNGEWNPEDYVPEHRPAFPSEESGMDDVPF